MLRLDLLTGALEGDLDGRSGLAGDGHRFVLHHVVVALRLLLEQGGALRQGVAAADHRGNEIT